MHRDVFGKWKSCIVGMPDYALSILDVYGGFDTSHPFNIMSTIYKPDLAKKASRTAMVGGMMLKKDFTSCSKLSTEVTKVSSAMIADFSTTQLMTNSMTVLMNSYSNLTTLSSALYSGDFKSIGKTTGEIFFTLFGNEKLATSLKKEA